MKFKILDVTENDKKIYINFETEYGKDKFRTDLENKSKDLLTGKPRWLLELSNHIKTKYKQTEKFKDIPHGFKSYLNQEIESEEIPDTRPNNIMSIQEESIKDLQEGIKRENEKIKQLFEETRILVNKRKQLLQEKIYLEKGIKELERTSLCDSCSDQDPNWLKDLIKIKGIATKTAHDIVKVYPTESSLKRAISEGKHLPFRDDIENILITNFK